MKKKWGLALLASAPMERILLSSLTIQAPTCELGSLERIPDIMATPMKYSSHDK